MTRTDIHRPSAILPADYVEVSYDYLGDTTGWFQNGVNPLALERARLRAHMERTGGTWSQHEHGGTCHICGALAMHLVIYQHVPTNTYIRTGTDCADKMSLSRDVAADNRFRAALRDEREAQAGKRKAQATLADLGLSAAWDFVAYVGSDRSAQTLRDMLGGLVRYGSWSEKQIAFARILVERIAKQPAIDAQRAAEAAAAPAWTAGRQIVTGQIVHCKFVESQVGWRTVSTPKCLLKLADGRKVWMTLPSFVTGSFEELKGTTLTVNVTIEPKETEPSFAFGKRPTAAKESK